MTKPITPERVRELRSKPGRCTACRETGALHCGDPSNCGGMVVEIPEHELRALLDAYGRECEWHQDADECDWVTSCGRRWEFIDGGPIENKMHRCMECGGKVKVTR